MHTAYETRQDVYHVPEHRRISQVLIEDEGTAREIFQHMTAGQSLKEATVQAEIGSPIDMGDVTRDALPGDIAQKVWSHTEAGPLEPLRSPMGWHVFSLGPIIPGAVQPFDAVRDNVTDYVKHTKATKRLNELLPRIEDALAAGESYSDVAQQFSIDVFRPRLCLRVQALSKKKIFLYPLTSPQIFLNKHTP